MTLPRTPSFRLDGKRALVTGASRGIGLAAAAALAEAGAAVHLVARGKAVLAEVAAELGDEARYTACDVTDFDAVAGLFADGPFDVVVNSAGLARHSAAVETRVEDFDVVTEINLKAAYFLAQAAARALILAGRPGSIIQISSQMAHVGGFDRAVYCATKHGVEGMTRAMAIEWGAHGIRVNTICPTFILTELTRPTFADPDKRAWIESKIKLGRVGELEDIMGPVVFLASDASALMTGASLMVDGGWTIG